MATDLDVALLQHIEQTDLNPLGEIRQLVHGEDAAVGARHQAVVKGEFIRQVPALSDLDRVNLTDQVSDRGVGGGEFLAEPIVAVHPRDRGVVAVLGNEFASMPRDGVIRVIVDLRPGHDRHPLVEQVGEATDHPRLCLASFPEKNDVMPGEQGVLELWVDRALVAEHLREQRLVISYPLDGIAPQLLPQGD